MLFGVDSALSGGYGIGGSGTTRREGWRDERRSGNQIAIGLSSSTVTGQCHIVVSRRRKRQEGGGR